MCAMCLLFIAFLYATGAFSSETGKVLFSEMIIRSDTIVYGFVNSLDSRYVELNDGKGRIIVTDVSMEVAECLQGNCKGKSYTFVLPGGVVNGREFEVIDLPKLNVGEEVILFVNEEVNRIFPIVGHGQGYFKIDRSDCNGFMINSNNQILTGIKNEVLQYGKNDKEMSKQCEEVVTVDNFISEIKTSVSKYEVANKAFLKLYPKQELVDQFTRLYTPQPLKVEENEK